MGTGAEAKAGQTVTMNYVGINYKSGKEFDSSWKRNEPFTFTLGKKQVIPGWEKGIPGMKVGGRRELVIPPALGVRRERLPPSIPPNETLDLRRGPAGHLAPRALTATAALRRPPITPARAFACAVLALVLALVVARGAGGLRQAQGGHARRGEARERRPRRRDGRARGGGAAGRSRGGGHEGRLAGDPRGRKGRPTASTRAKVAAAAQRAAQVRLPSLFTEEGSAQLTGPALPLAGQFRSFQTLGSRSWQLLDSSLEEIEHGSRSEARFARQNLPLYIESIYDAHFTLAEIGKQLLAAYKKLGGAEAFGGSLTPAQIQQLADEYSKERNELSPKERVKLGS